MSKLKLKIIINDIFHYIFFFFFICLFYVFIIGVNTKRLPRSERQFPPLPIYLGSHAWTLCFCRPIQVEFFVYLFAFARIRLLAIFG